MSFDFFKNEKVLCFLGGAAAVIIGKKIIESQKVHDMCVAGVARGMQVAKEAKATAVNIREEAEDICKEAQASIADEEDNEIQNSTRA